jgi:hypothetical protein
MKQYNINNSEGEINNNKYNQNKPDKYTETKYSIILLHRLILLTKKQHVLTY